MQIKRIESILFYVIERFRLFQSTPKTTSIFYMTFITANSRVKDIFQSVFSEKLVADHPHASSHFPSPHTPKLCDSVDCHFFFLKMGNELLIIQVIPFDDRSQDLFFLDNKGDNAFSKIFGDVFGLISRFIDRLSFSFFMIVQG
jgi:hypothetical protein